jgi:hypothetical protein
MVENQWLNILNAYLVNSVQGSNTYYGISEHAAIMSKNDGGAVWVSTDGFKFNSALSVEVAKEDGSSEKVTINEFNNLLSAIAARGDPSKMAKGGVYFMGHKWVVIDGFEGTGYYTQYLKREGGGAAVTLTNNGTVALVTFDKSKDMRVLKQGDDEKAFAERKPMKQAVGYVNQGIDGLSKYLIEAGL